jgi:DNA (cytosine-5)-methyltransferase 1
MGYHLAGFDVVGVDVKAQPRYPFAFVQSDALEYVAEHGREFDAIHASPPCQAHSNAQKIRGNDHPDLVAPTRAALSVTGRPWIIENVLGAPLINPTLLCGTMFGLNVYRHRLFETSFPVPLILHPAHHAQPVKMGRRVKAGDVIQVVGNFTDVAYARAAMGIDWMTRDGLSQAIPPAYTEFLGRQLLAVVQRLAA